MSEPYVSMDDDGTAWSDDGIPCPYCGNVRTDDLSDVTGAYTEDGGELECSRCEKSFKFSTFISHSYTSRKP